MQLLRFRNTCGQFNRTESAESLKSSQQIMNEQSLKDHHGKVIGYIVTGSDGQLTIYTVQRVRKGYYDPKRNKTFDVNNLAIGTGNQLSTLIVGI